MQAWFVLAVAAGYVTTLFLIAWWGDRRSVDGPLVSPKSWAAAISYCLTLAVYNTSWSFYGSVGRAATSGLDFVTIYVGPTLVLLFGQPLLSKVIAIAKAQNVTSISDFIAARYGKSQGLAAFVTLASLLGVLPYIALQLKAVGKSFDYLILQPERAGGESLRFWQDSAFGVAASMALFAIVFGVRHVHASEHHRGLMLAIAFESVVKLVAFLIVALFVLFGLSGGPVTLLSQFQSDPQLAAILTFDPAQPVWPSTILISAIAFLCLPQAFHVAVVENEAPSHTRTAAWLYPTYLALFSLLILPIAAAGLARFGAMMDPDTYVISLPVAADATTVSLIAFLGGLSAATGMVIMTSVALSTMLCNDVIMPLVLRSRFFGLRAQSQPVTSMLVAVRRLSILGILLLAYLVHRLVNQTYPLTVIGLLSFVAVAQFGPAFVGGLFWQHANKTGASIGIAVGFFVWGYTLLLPSAAPLWPAIDEIIRQGPWRLAWLKPNALFGLEGLDPISHATLWSLTANLVCFLAFSALGRQSTVERNQAAAYADGVVREMVPKLSSRVVVRLDDLRALALRFVGVERGSAAFDSYRASRTTGAGPPLDPSGLVDLDSIRFTENLLAGAIGAASARVVIAASLEGHSLSRREAMAMLDEASEALRFNRTLLQSTLESVPQGICAFDADFNITAWNGRFIALLDLPPDFVRVGLPLAELIVFNVERGEYAASEFAALLVNRDVATQSWPYLYERKRPDGTVLEIVYDRVAEGGYVSTYTDVTERHRAAEALRRANEDLELRVRERTEALEQAKAEAEQANLDKTRFLAAASHDLLQPLNAARLFLSALDESLHASSQSGDADKERTLAGSAITALRSTEHVLDRLLDISSYDAGAVRAEPFEFPIADLLVQLNVEFSAMARERGLALRVVDCSIAVHSDPHLLRRILQNLLSNALRYTRKGRILLGCRRRGGDLRIEVWDTGVGIAAEDQKRIFEEFHRLAPGSEKGLGLGLAIVDRVSRLLGHAVDVRSRPGRGSCFAVTVPLARGAGTPLQRKPASAAPAVAERAMTILCLDNDATILDGLTALLGGWGHHVLVAADADGAMLAAAASPPDVVLLDYHLDGGRSGLDFLDDLRQKSGRDVRALIVTADRSEAVRKEARARGCEILSKPVKPAALRRFLGGEALSRQFGAKQRTSSA
ncbi:MULTISPECIES: hybrid sensor histidine kinase/response regulator [Bradyrhizobium]|uniref:hybrid sensor histidine kinase/response regulator n=1 Tax=Bradyrhizobium TaxID=374 RepID=UPI000231CD05|nr:PAS domain-containing hybrid sensor histidine kinase/response regulator [Bradyrhizobium japonicum]AJA62113.1 histidine kinase [Bradyrhizobium japonicum]KMK00708.1 histidine kinase [Bradyrhizobium japonicum]MBR0759426.1 hybrid sensor histidine kinase/response regulator [Bradyrhizobium japonicum]MCS3541494.1 Na+/proline symporter/signal transduction histidine kinase/ActR/RegA family two-component response regulator [Bradyrhizobium japonicum]MCS3991322.1 Na+/proline symporter/signal transducti